MRILGMLVLSGVFCALTSCSSVNTTHTAIAPKPAHQAQANTATTTKKDPAVISFYTNGNNPKNAYTVLGLANISRTNRVGIKRQDAVIHDAMRTAAAKLGGDAVIEVSRNNQAVVGKIICYHSKEHPQLIA